MLTALMLIEQRYSRKMTQKKDLAESAHFTQSVIARKMQQGMYSMIEG